MFKQKRMLLKKSKTYNLTFSSFASGMNDSIDENILPLRFAKKLYNFTIKNGALKSGLGISQLVLPRYYNDNFTSQRVIPPFDQDEGVQNLWHFPYYSNINGKMYHILLFHGEGGGIYYMLSVVPYHSFSYLFPIDNFQFDGEVSAMNYRLDGEDVMIFVVAKEEKIVVSRPELLNTVIENAPKLISICKHYERLFAILEGDRKTLMFSANLDPTNWNAELDEGGFIQMYDERGQLLKLVSFNDYIYVFREFGITKVSAYGDQESFSVSHLAVSSSKIFPDSITCCGDIVFYLAEDGIHTFDGYNSNKLNLNIESLFVGENNDNCRGLFHNNKYYLACRLNFDDNNLVGCESHSTGYINNALIEYDITSGDLNILRGVDIKNMCTYNDYCFNKAVCCFNGVYKSYFGEISDTGKYFNEVLQKSWVSPYSNLGYPNKFKIIKEVILKTEGDIKIKIKTNIEEKEYSARGKRSTQRIKTNVCGELVQITFTSEKDTPVNISSPQLTVVVV